MINMKIQKIRHRAKAQAVDDIAERAADHERNPGPLQCAIVFQKPQGENSAYDDGEGDQNLRPINEIAVQHAKADALVPHHDQIEKRKDFNLREAEQFRFFHQPGEKIRDLHRRALDTRAQNPFDNGPFAELVERENKSGYQKVF